MSLISTTIPNLINGVSQQPEYLRLASQCEEQINGYATVVDGLRKRPGTRHVKKLPTLDSNLFLHTINRDEVEQYLVAISNGNLRVFDLAGNEKTVNFPNGKAYLNSADPEQSFRCVTVADYTFVLNTKTVVSAAGTTSPTRPVEALVWVKQGTYAGKYNLWVNGAYASYTVPDGSESAHAASVTTDNIAAQLRSQISTALGAGWQVTQYGSTLYIRRDDGGSFTITTSDSLGDSGVVTVIGQTQRFTNLPAKAVNGFVVEVAGDQSSSFDNYYVRYEVTAGATGSGVWKETVKGGEITSLNAATMPHGLVREANGTFTFKQLSWEPRTCGDLDSNPMPSFVGRPLTDIFFHRNRLGFIADESIIFSAAGDFFNFFRGTATAVLDSDPIDVAVSHVKVSLLRHAVPFNETLLLFSDQTQFQLGATDILSPNTVSVRQTTEYECSLRAKPVGAGRYVYFAVNRGNYTGIREYFVDVETQVQDALEVTGHVPRYIPNNVFKIAVSGTEDCLALLSKEQRNKIWIYKYYWNEREKLQSSWFEWEFAANYQILNIDFIESRMYLVVRRGSETYLEYLDLDPGSVESGWDFTVHLDSKVTNASFVASTYNAGSADTERDNTTTITLPLLNSSGNLQVVMGPGSSSPGRVLPILSTDTSGGNTTITVEGNHTSTPLFVGRAYTLRYKFSTLAVREEAPGGGQNVVGEGRLQLRRMSLLYANSGYFRVQVSPLGRSNYTYTFTGRKTGSLNNTLGAYALETGKFSFPLMSKNDQVDIEILNDSFLPSYFLSAEWEGLFVLRSRRL